MCCQTSRDIGRRAPPLRLVFKSASPSGSSNILVSSPNRHKFSPLKKQKVLAGEKGILAGICKKKKFQNKKESFVQRIPNVISHKYANDIISYMMIYILAATLGPLQKNEKVEEKWNLGCSI